LVWYCVRWQLYWLRSWFFCYDILLGRFHNKLSSYSMEIKKNPAQFSPMNVALLSNAADVSLFSWKRYTSILFCLSLGRSFTSNARWSFLWL
jgi:hypothetical protein